jgi:hypothetical protein
MRNITSVLVLLSVVLLCNLSAQAPTPVEPGARVRVTGPEACGSNTVCAGPRPVRRQTGVFVAYERDTLTLSGGVDPAATHSLFR